jgi:hypothetical protein
MELEEPSFPLIPDSANPKIPSLIFDDPPPVQDLLDPLSEAAIELAPPTEQEDILAICKTHRETLASLRRSVMTNRVAYERQSQLRAKHTTPDGSSTTANPALVTAKDERDAIQRKLNDTREQLAAISSAEVKLQALLESSSNSPLALIEPLANEMTRVNRLRSQAKPPLYLFIAPTPNGADQIVFSKAQAEVLLQEPGNRTLTELCQALEDYESGKIERRHP